MFVQLDAEATMIAVRICLATTTIAKIHAKVISADQMLCVKLRITQPNANAPPVSMAIQRQNKAAFEFRRHAFRPADARTVTCASETIVKCHAVNQLHAPSAKGVIIMFAQKFATQITIVCPGKFAMNVEHANRDVKPKLIAHPHRSALVENANAVAVSLEHRSVARISMSAPIKFATRAPFVKIRLVHLDVCAQNKPSAIHTLSQVACFQTNAHEMKTAPRIWHVSKESAQNRAPLLNADEMQFARAANTKHSANARPDISAIQPIKSPVASESNASATKNAAKTNIVIHKSTNVKVSTFVYYLQIDR